MRHLTALLVAAVLDPYGAAGNGTSDPNGAPALVTGHAYVDTFTPGQKRYYTITVPEGASPYVSATLIRPWDSFGDSVTDEVTIGLATTDDHDCGSQDESDSQTDSVRLVTVVAEPGPARTRGATWSNGFSSDDQGCGKPGTYVVSVERDRDTADQTARRIALYYLAEPPVTGQPPSPSPVNTGKLAGPAPPDFTAAAKAVPGSDWMGTAPRVDSPVVNATIRPGETRYWQVPLQWGQRLSYAIRFDKVDVDDSASVGTWVVNPVRADVDTIGSDASTTYDGKGDTTPLRNSTVPVAYGNRGSDSSEVDPVRFAGPYLIALHMNPNQPLAGKDIPVHLAIRVSGSAQAGPGYQNTKDTSARAGGTASADRHVRWEFLAGGAAALLLALLLLGWPKLTRRTAFRG
ncbi:MAG: hypothetical protein ACJ73S_05900 [Mycobacteriales bacterium]